MQARDAYVRTVDALFSKAFRKVFSPFHPVFSCDCCFAGMPLSDAPLQCASCSDGWQDSIPCRESRPTMMLMIMLMIMMRKRFEERGLKNSLVLIRDHDPDANS